MDIELIVDIVIILVVYLVIGMWVAYFVKGISYLANDYFVLATILYPIILPILLYFELKRFVKELKEKEEDEDD